MSVKGLVIRGPYDPSVDPGISFDPDEGLTQQQFAAECDINNIMRRYQATGVVQHLNSRQPEFGDFSDPVDFQQGLNTVVEAQAMFAELPAYLRDRFGNDPLKMLEFLAVEENRDEAIKLGIVKAPEPPAEPMAVRVVADPDAAPLSPAQPAKPAAS